MTTAEQAPAAALRDLLPLVRPHRRPLLIEHHARLLTAVVRAVTGGR